MTNLGAEMPRFSKHFKINAPQSQLDFVDVSTDYDTQVYVDPYAIEMRDDAWSGQCSELIRSFFLEVLDSLRAGDDLRAQGLMSHLHEPAETFLGVSADEPQGRGVGQTQAFQLVSRIKRSKAFQTGVLSDLSEIALFVERIGRDKVSDLTTNVIRSKLIEYTQQQCDLYGIPTHDYNGPPIWNGNRKNWVSMNVELPLIGNTPVMLVPKYIVRRQLSLNSQDFYNKQITDFLVAEHRHAVSSLVQTLKSPARITKTEVREKNPNSKNMLADMASRHPHLLEIYKDIARSENRILVNIEDDDISVAQACTDLGAALQNISTGPQDADRYHMVAMHIITLCFFPDLTLPHKEWEINDGRKRIDIVYTIAANEGFFAHRRDAKNTRAAMLVVECKNYSKDIANPEIDQLLGRFDNNRGYLGFMLCRGIDNNELMSNRCKDLAKTGKAYILTFEDRELLELLDARMHHDNDRLQNILHTRFRSLIS
jgi:hypothetical protein